MAAVDTQPKDFSREEAEEPEEEGLSLSHPVHSDGTRRWIVASYWVVVILVLPVWYYMTSIERLPLPTERIERLSHQEVSFPINIEVNLGDSYDADLQKTYAPALEAALARVKQQSRAFHPLEFHVGVRDEPSRRDPCAPVVEDEDGEDGYAGVAESEDYYHLDFRMKDATRQYMTCGRHLVVGGRERPMSVSPVAETLRDLIAPYSNPKLHPPSAESRIAQYSPTYRLAFTLLNEDASVGGAATGWEIQQALSRYIQPTLAQLRDLHNFTIESQIQQFGGLTFDPEGPVVDQSGRNTWALSEEQMSVFVNSAEWTLTSGVSNDPVLHFILYVPSADRRPLVTHPSTPGQRNDSFILPQWGGVVIHNPPAKSGEATPNTFLTAHDLDEPFKVFRYQLAALLGVPRLPPLVTPADRTKSTITPWQLDALKRRRAMENTHNSADALKSIVNLVHQIENMPVGHDVLGQVDGALAALDATTHSPHTSTSLTRTLKHSIHAFVLSSQAFFNPGMIGLLYYPTEHKYAVYTPLFAPVAVPLIVALIREVRAARDRRRASAGKQKAD